VKGLKKLFRWQRANAAASDSPDIHRPKLTAEAISHSITQAVSVFRGSPQLSDEEIYRVLVKSGMERRRAARLIELLPTAYFCVMFADSGIRLPQTLRRDPGDGRVSVEKPLQSEEVWEPALAFARAEADAGIAEQDWLAVVGRGAEFNAVNDALQQGRTLESLKGASFITLLFWPEDGPEISG
jgi:hypothetical protein